MSTDSAGPARSTAPAADRPAGTRVLVINSGSSSVKYQLLDMAGRTGADGTGTAGTGPDGTGAVRLASGLVERIGEGPVADHAAALRQAAAELDERGLGLDSPDLAAVGHRVVHGGTRFTEPTRITDEVVAGIEELIPLAPLHNPANIQGIKVARELRPDLPQVAVFDTAFHSTMPEHAARYAIDTATADAHGVRRYGFHGTSHACVSRAAAALLGREPAEVNVIVLHLGNGASASAVAGGVCVETSMGLTPLEGLVMGTRSGDLDPAVIFHLSRVAGMSTDEIDTLLNKRSGLLGLCGDNDMREIGRRMAEGDRAAGLAFEIYVHRLRKYVGSYTAVLGRVDVIAFTAGVGENSAAVREAAMRGLEALGIALDPVRNALRGSSARLISADGSRTAVAVIPTDEELEIATQTYALVGAVRD
ncbi:acetate kinase [Streptomyces xinghaiensis]|uniref:Acetate kinase n=1 Tax=Streptomyces xinghaiensis TaxID=1038928 RepID=A0A3R7IBF8_9ACTN|nr:acetate kinase [Streptomyces xinghaiensis]RKM98038.1 acetate kinase [Streptomyces xinghaiensis]RNC75266.1 acetate kinase [Streptomyces xinghaiensis]